MESWESYNSIESLISNRKKEIGVCACVRVCGRGWRSEGGRLLSRRWKKKEKEGMGRWRISHCFEMCPMQSLWWAVTTWSKLIQQADPESNMKTNSTNATSTLTLSLSKLWVLHSAHRDRLQHYYTCCQYFWNPVFPHIISSALGQLRPKITFWWWQ